VSKFACFSEMDGVAGMYGMLAPSAFGITWIGRINCTDFVPSLGKMVSLFSPTISCSMTSQWCFQRKNGFLLRSRTGYETTLSSRRQIASGFSQRRSGTM